MYKFGDSYSCNPLYGWRRETIKQHAEWRDDTEMLFWFNLTSYDAGMLQVTPATHIDITVQI